MKDGDTVLLDMGSEYSGYATDITCSYPVNGVFTDAQKMVHNAVWNAQSSVMKAMKPGVQWIDMHRLAERCILNGLIDMNILHKSGDSSAAMIVTDDDESAFIDELMSVHMASLFMPHGLGHFVGLNVHGLFDFVLLFDVSSNLTDVVFRCRRLH